MILCAVVLMQDGPAQRIPEPSADAQKQAVKAIKDLFKDEYAKKAAADQVELARKLMTTSADASIDMPTKYACLTEARDLAAAASDATLALEAVSLLGKSFMIAVPGAKMAVLGKMAGTTKESEKLRALSRSYYEVAKDSVTAEDYDTAASAAAKADTLARAVKDASIPERVAELKKDLAQLKSEYQKVKAALDAPGSGDADAAGRYLCTVRNDWPAGLKLLADGGKSPWKELAAKDLANPEMPEAQVEVGDGWWQQAQAEKMAWKKLSLMGRARHWYERAEPAATGLLKIRLEKRLAEAEGQVPGGVNVLRLVDPKRDAVHGEWAMVDGVLTDEGQQSLSLQIPYEPPDEYDFHVVVKRMGGGDSVVLGVPVNGKQVSVLIDGYPDAGMYLQGFEPIDGKYLNAQPGALKMKQLIPPDKPVAIDVAVRKASITVSVDGKKIMSYEGAMSRLSGRDDSKTPDEKALYVGGWNGKKGFTEIRVMPLSGPGKKIRQ
jgi:hypothetical protein